RQRAEESSGESVQPSLNRGRQGRRTRDDADFLDREACLLEFLTISCRRREVPRAEPMRVEPPPRKDRAQCDDDRRGVVVTAHLTDKPAARLERPMNAGEHCLRWAHPMKRRV